MTLPRELAESAPPDEELTSDLERMTAKRRTRLERETQLHVMSNMMLDGNHEMVVVRKMAKELGLPESVVKRDVQEVKRRWWRERGQMIEEGHPHFSLLKALDRRERLYLQAMGRTKRVVVADAEGDEEVQSVPDPDVATALSAEKDRALLAGLYPEKKSEGGGANVSIHFSLDSIVQELKRAREAAPELTALPVEESLPCGLVELTKGVEHVGVECGTTGLQGQGGEGKELAGEQAGEQATGAGVSGG